MLLPRRITAMPDIPVIINDHAASSCCVLLLCTLMVYFFEKVKTTPKRITFEVVRLSRMSNLARSEKTEREIQ